MARYATQADVDLYGPAIEAEGITPSMQVDDVIYFYADRNAANDNLYSKSEWPLARNGATLWIEGNAGVYNTIDLGIEDNTKITMPSDESNPNHIRFFGGQGLVSRQTGGLGGRDMQFYNFNNLVIDFETNSNPGMRDGWGSGRTGTFGVKIANIMLSKSGMGIKVDHTGHTMKTLVIRGCELSAGSFAKIRAILSENHLTKFLIERNLITRSVGGEGLYLGQTSRLSGDDYNSIKYTIRNNIFAFTAAEALQMQQCADGSRIHNNVIFISGHDFKAAFQPFQDTCIQMTCIQGDVHFFNNVIYGHGSVGIQVFGVPGESQTPPVLFGSNVPKIYNNVIGGAKKGNSYRIHESFIYGNGVTFRDNDIVDPQRNYEEVGDNVMFYAEIPNNVAAVNIIGGSAPDDAATYLNESRSNAPLKGMFNVTRGAVETPQFVKTGFDGIDVHKISKWSSLYQVGWYWGYTKDDNATNVINMTTLGSTHTFEMFQSSSHWVAGDKVKAMYRDADYSFHATVVSYSDGILQLGNISHKVGTGTSVSTEQWDVMMLRTITAGDFCWLAEDGEVMDMNLYKCLTTHQSVVGDLDQTRPDNKPEYWELVWWDSEGRNMYDPLYNGTPFTTDFMAVAGDFRLVKGSYHHLKGRGLLCNEQREDQTMMGWQWKQTDAGTIRDIPGAYNDKLTISDYSYLTSGRYYRFWVEKRKSDGTFEPRIYSAWNLIA